MNAQDTADEERLFMNIQLGEGAPYRVELPSDDSVIHASKPLHVAA